MKTFKGELFGVELKPRGKNDYHISVEIIASDDGNWFSHEGSFSSYWIDDLIEQLQSAKDHMEKNEKPDRVGQKQYGYKFKYKRPR